MVVDRWYRSLIKTGTWRVIAFVVLGIISYFATGSLALAGSIALADWIFKSALYFGHELIWARVNLGRVMMKKKGSVVWLTGLSGSGKTTIADAVAEKLEKQLIPVKRLDGDVARRTFSSNLGFTKEDRDENNRRAAHVASYLSEEHVVLASFISPYQEQRDYVRDMCDNFYEVHVSTPISVCERRDPKGLYCKVRSGEIKSFTGIHADAPYQSPTNPDLVIRTYNQSFNLEIDRDLDDCVDELISFMRKMNII